MTSSLVVKTPTRNGVPRHRDGGVSTVDEHVEAEERVHRVVHAQQRGRADVRPVAQNAELRRANTSTNTNTTTRRRRSSSRRDGTRARVYHATVP